MAKDAVPLRVPSAVLPRQPLVVLVIALAVGIALDRWGGLEAAVVWWVAATGSLAGWWVVWRRGSERLAAAILLVGVAATGAAWHHVCWDMFDRHEIARYAFPPSGGSHRQPTCIEAIATERPHRMPAPLPSAYRAIPKGERSRLEITLCSIRDGTRWQPLRGRARLTVNGHLLGIRAGDRVQVFGQLSQLPAPSNPGQFDFAAQGRADRRLASVASSAPECVTVVRRSTGFSLQRVLDDLRAAGQRLLWQHVGSRRAGLASAIVLGNRDGVPRDVTQHYMVTGTIHLLVVSGLHVGILALGLVGGQRLGIVPRRMALVAIVALVVGYALVAGARPPVVRAAVLVGLVCLAAWTGRRGVALNSLAAAAIVVLALNPADLFRTGTQLSFLAVATLIVVGTAIMRRREAAEIDPIDRLIRQSQPWYRGAIRWIFQWNGRLLMATLAVWLTALPLVMQQFHVVAPSAILISPLIWPLIGAALLGGFGVLATGWLAPPLAGLFGQVCDLALNGLETLVSSTQPIPGSHFWVAGPADWWVAGFYFGLLVFLATGSKLIAYRYQVATCLLWVTVGFVSATVVPSTVTGSAGLEIDFIAVGHGSCVCLRAPTGETLIYDAGSLSSPHFAAQTISTSLWEKGLHGVDGIVLSHADVDHFNAVPGLLDRFHVGRVYVSPFMFDGFDASAGQRSAPAQLQRLLTDQGIEIEEIWANDRLRLGPEVEISVLHPTQEGVLGNDNASSVTLLIEYAGRKVLLPGDLESPGLDQLMAELPIDCDVIMAPHHGSRRSDPPGFARWCTPEWVVVSGGRGNNGIDLMERSYRAAGGRVVRTDQLGAVQVSIGPEGHIEVSCYREPAMVQD